MNQGSESKTQNFVKLLEVNRTNFHDPRLLKKFLVISWKTEPIKYKTDKLNFIKIKNFLFRERSY